MCGRRWHVRHDDDQPVLRVWYDTRHDGETKITAIQAGVSRRSICNIGQSVIYASHDGLVSARGVNVDMNYSLQLFTREDWRDRYASKLDKLHLDAHDGNLVAWFDDGTPGFLIRFDGEALSFLELSEQITASFVIPGWRRPMHLNGH